MAEGAGTGAVGRVSRLSWQRTPLLERLFAGHVDVLAALRSLRRSPGFVAIAVLSLGLGVGLNTTTLSMIDAIRHPYVPYRDPAELYSISTVSWGRDRVAGARDMYEALVARRDLYADQVPMVSSVELVEGTEGMQNRFVSYVGPNFFDLLGVSAIRGRVFHAGANGSADASGAVISSGLWQAQFGGDPHLDQLKLTIGGVSRRVIGVLPAAMSGSVFVPMPVDSVRTLARPVNIESFVRLRPGMSRAYVKAQLQQVSRRVALDAHDDPLMFDYRVFSLNPEPQPIRALDVALAGAALLALLVACFNLANLMLVRGLARRREVAVRLAVGASTGAIIRYVLTECVILAMLGGSWGLLASMWGVKAAERYMPRAVESFGFVAPHLSWRVAAIGIATVVAAILLVGVLPAFRASRVEVGEAMKEGGAGTTGRATRSQYALVIAEVAMSLVVMMAAGLLIRAANRQDTNVTWGYDVDHVLLSAVYPTAAACSTSTSGTYLSDLAAHLNSTPDVRYATAYRTVALPGRRITSDAANAAEARELSYTVATPDYFKASGIGIAKGRDFLPGDLLGGGVAIIDRGTAALLWPLQSPIGRMLKLGASKSNAPWVRVVGVSGSVNDLSNPDAATARGNPVVVGPSTCGVAGIRVRVAQTKGRTPTAIFHALVAAAPGARVMDVRSPKAGYEAIVASRRLIAGIFIMIGVFALSLAAIGVYAILSYMVGQRYREFAMRIALGAEHRDIFAIVWHDALVMVLAGTGIGAFGAMAFGPLLGEDWLNQVLPTDVISLVSAEVVLMLVALAVCIPPVRRAMRANPVDLLRAL